MRCRKPTGVRAAGTFARVGLHTAQAGTTCAAAAVQAPSRSSASRIGQMGEEAREELERYRVVRTLVAGEYFGELACLTGVRRTATVVAVQYSETMSLSKDALDATVSEFPAYKFSISTEVEGYHTLVQELIGSRQPVALEGAAAAGGRRDAGEAEPPSRVSAEGPQRGRSPRETGDSCRPGVALELPHRRSHSAPSLPDRASGDGGLEERGSDSGGARRSVAPATGAAGARRANMVTAARTGLLERMRLLDVAVEGDAAEEGVPGAAAQQHVSQHGCAQAESPAAEPGDAASMHVRQGRVAPQALPQVRSTRSSSTASMAAHGISSQEMQEALGDGAARVQQLVEQLQQQAAGPGVQLQVAAAPHRGRFPVSGAGPGPKEVGATIAPSRNELQDFMRTVSDGTMQLHGHGSVDSSGTRHARPQQRSDESALSFQPQ